MATTRTTFTLDARLAERARQFKVNISAAARGGVAAAVKRAMGEADREAYERFPEQARRFLGRRRGVGSRVTRPAAMRTPR